MRLNPVKRKILEEMAQHAQPRRPKEIAEKVGVNFSSCMMHILGLKKAGYVSSPVKGYYKITDLGVDIVDIQVGEGEVASILASLGPDKTFYFYTGVDQYSGMRADSLFDFSEKIKDVSITSLEFHLVREDFERWLKSIGDVKLAKKLAVIREKGVSGEELRSLIYEAVKIRYEVLQESLVRK